MSSQNVTVFNFDGKFDVRTILDDNDSVLFVAKDVATALGYADTAQAVRAHCKHAKSLRDLGVVSGTTLDPQTKLIPESDVYRLTLKSTLPSADQFQDWVVEDVLPQIRKTGSYVQQQPPTPVTNVQLGAMGDRLTAIISSVQIALSGVTGLKPEMAAVQMFKVIENETGTNLNPLRLALPYNAGPQCSMNATAVGQMMGISAVEVGKLLTFAGLAFKNARKDWEITEEGKKYGEMFPYTNKGHSGYQPLWSPEVVPVLEKARSAMTFSYATGV